LQKPHSDSNPLGDVGCTLGPLDASAQMATSPRKEEKRKDISQKLQFTEQPEKLTVSQVLVQLVIKLVSIRPREQLRLQWLYEWH